MEKKEYVCNIKMKLDIKSQALSSMLTEVFL